MLSQGLIIVHYEGKIFWKTLPNVTYVISVSSLVGGTKPIPSPGWAADAVPVRSSWMVQMVVSLHAAPICPLLNAHRTPQEISWVCFLCSMLLPGMPPLETLDASVSRLSAWPVQLIHSTGLCLRLPSQCHGLETFSKQSAEVNAGLSFFVSHLSRVTVFQCLIYRALNLLFPYRGCFR